METADVTQGPVQKICGTGAAAQKKVQSGGPTQRGRQLVHYMTGLCFDPASVAREHAQ